uniref:Uncharacterized protein n=1 Tax=Strongyloides stercoralis TaxID=6248 RepID=A0AAF5I2X7_STRER
MEDPFEQDINKLNSDQDENIVQEITLSTPFDENKNEVNEINKNDEEFDESEKIEENKQEDEVNVDDETEKEDKVEEVNEVIEIKITQDKDEEENLEDKEEVKEENLEKDTNEEIKEEDKVDEIEESSKESEGKEINDEEKTEDQVPDITATDGGDLMTTSMDGIDDIPEEEIKMPVEGGPPGDETQVVVDEDNVVPTTPSEDIKDVVAEEVKEETDEIAEKEVEKDSEEKPAEDGEIKEEEVKVDVAEEKKEEESVEVTEEKKEEEAVEVVEEKKEEATEEVSTEVVEEKKDEVVEETKDEVVEEKKDEAVEEKTDEVVEEKKDEATEEIKDEVANEGMEDKVEDISVAPSEHEFELQPPPTPKRKQTPCELDNVVAEQEQESSKVETDETQGTPKVTTPAADSSIKESVPPTPVNEQSAKESIPATPVADEASKELTSVTSPKEESAKEEVPSTPIVDVSVKEEVPPTPVEESVKESVSEAPISEVSKNETSVGTPKVSIVTPATPKSSVATPKASVSSPKTPATPKTSISSPKTPATPKRSVAKSKKSTSKFQFDDVSEPSKKSSVSETPKSAKLSVSGTPAEISSETPIAEETNETEASVPDDVFETPSADSETTKEVVEEEPAKDEQVEEVQTEEPAKEEATTNEEETKETNEEEAKVEEPQPEETKDDETKVEEPEQVRKVSYREPEAEVNEISSAISSSQNDTIKTSEERKEPPTRNYQPYDQDSHRVTGPTKLQSNSSFSSWMPTESASYTPKSPYVLNTAYKYKTDYISSYRPPSSFYTTMFDDIVSTGPFSSSLYATNRLLERSRSRTRERKSALRNIRSSSNYTKYISSAPSPMRTREYSTPPTRELSRPPSRSGSFVSFMEYSGAKQYELARDSSRNNIFDGLCRSASRGDVDLYSGSGRLSRVDSYVTKMNHNYDYETPKTYSMYRSTSRPNISYTPSYTSYNPYYVENDSTLSRMKRYARETVNPTGYRSMYEVSTFPRLHQMRLMSLYNTYYPNITNPFLLTQFPNPHLYHYQLQGYVGELQRSLSREKYKNDRLRSQYTKVSHQLEQACKQMDLLRTNSYSLCRSGSAPRCSVYSRFYPYY